MWYCLLVNSQKVYHTIKNKNSNRQSLIFTNYDFIVVNVKKKDIFILNSQKVYHTIKNKDSNRQSFVFTNHNFVVKYFYTLNELNLFSKFNKIDEN